MANQTFTPTHVQNLTSLQNYLKSIDTSLNALGHTIGAELKSLDSSLNKGTVHPRKYLPKSAPRLSTEQILYRGLLGDGQTFTNSSNSTIYRTSTNQLWAQLASGISKSMGRSL